ncbi:hypothetical protein ACSSS7_004909 [Eimeria intestinalis]
MLPQSAKQQLLAAAPDEAAAGSAAESAAARAAPPEAEATIPESVASAASAEAAEAAEAAAAKRGPRVLVTVGTTSFDALIEAASCPSFVSCLSSIYCTALTLQIGKGIFVPFGITKEDRGLATDSGVYVHLSGFECVRVVRFIDCLSSHLYSFDLVISHGGAGSLLECLRAGIRVVACVNSKLLNNHQAELSVHLSNRNHCLSVIDLEDLPNKTREAWRRPFAPPPPPPPPPPVAAATAAAGGAASAPRQATQQQQQPREQQQQEQQQQQQQDKEGMPLVPLPSANREIFYKIIWEEVGCYPGIDVPLYLQPETEPFSPVAS